MIKCHLSRLIGERKLKISEIARATGLNRNTITLLYKEQATRIDLDAIDKLCVYLGCPVADLLEHVPEDEHVDDHA